MSATMTEVAMGQRAITENAELRRENEQLRMDLSHVVTQLHSARQRIAYLESTRCNERHKEGAFDAAAQTHIAAFAERVGER